MGLQNERNRKSQVMGAPHTLIDVDAGLKMEDESWHLPKYRRSVTAHSKFLQELSNVSMDTKLAKPFKDVAQ